MTLYGSSRYIDDGEHVEGFERGTYTKKRESAADSEEGPE